MQHLNAPELRTHPPQKTDIYTLKTNTFIGLHIDCNKYAIGKSSVCAISALRILTQLNVFSECRLCRRCVGMRNGRTRPESAINICINYAKPRRMRTCCGAKTTGANICAYCEHYSLGCAQVRAIIAIVIVRVCVIVCSIFWSSRHNVPGKLQMHTGARTHSQKRHITAALVGKMLHALRPYRVCGGMGT